MISTPVYTLTIGEVYRTLETSPKGLTAEEVIARQALYGENILREEPRERYFRRLFLQFGHPMALLLWGAGLFAALIGEPLLGLFIWTIVVVNAGFSLWREYRAEQAVSALRQLLPGFSRVVRDGVELQVKSNELVPGDVLILAEGDHVPADSRVVEEYGLRVNQATLTGEAMPARKTIDASVAEGISDLDRPNLIFAGTSIISGTCKAVVFSTGMLTQFGRIAHLTQTVKERPTPIQRELNRVTRIISFVALGIGIVVFIVGIMDVGLELGETLILALGIIVAAIPEGLPATTTLSYAMAAQRLAQRGVLVKKLAVMETLGTVTMICTDKSGTLTQNQMTVRKIWVNEKQYDVSGSGYNPQGSITPTPDGSVNSKELKTLLAAASLCNNSRLLPPSPERPYWSNLGDQTEAALHVAALKGDVSKEKVSKKYPRIHELPFDARRKRMTTIHVMRNGKNPGGYVAYVKGAPREVLQLCTQVMIDGEAQPLDDELRAEILSVNDDYARGVLRVLAFAQRSFPADTPPGAMHSIERVERDLTFLGLIGMMDPPREEVLEAVQTCRQAGIRMVMITGDYGLTAESLARRIGLVTTSHPLIVTGADLDQMDDHELGPILNEEAIFARMAPEHKMRLVAAYQTHGEVVAVTGDGVNDAPALRKADVGVAMGIAGTDVSREAADVILISDNFASITTAIEEGRAVFDNLRKFITYIFSSNVPEIVPFMLTAMFQLPLAMTVRQILAIDLGTDLFPALALSVEKPEPDVMLRPPRQRDKPLITRSLLLRAFLWLGVIETILCYFGFFLVYDNGMSWARELFPALQLLPTSPAESNYALALTMFYAGVVTAQVGNAFACRTERNRGSRLGWLSNPFLLAGIAIELAILLTFIYFPPLATVLALVPLPAEFWLLLVLFAPILYSLDWIRKWLVRLRDRNKIAG